MSKAIAWFAVGVVALSAAPAGAAKVRLYYEITGGAVEAEGEQIAEITGGHFSLSYAVAAATGVPEAACATAPVTGHQYQRIPGQTVLHSFSVRVALPTFYATYGSWSVKGGLIAPTLGSDECGQPVVGNLASLPGGGFKNVLAMNLVGPRTVHCTPFPYETGYCDYYGYATSVPRVLEIAFDIGADGGLVLAPPSGSAHGTCWYQNVWDDYTYVGTVSFVGEEINRVFVPEPSGTALALTALASLAGLARGSRRRRLGQASGPPCETEPTRR